MSDANLMQMVWGFAGGVISCLLCYGILSLKIFRMQLAIAAIREALLSLRNTRANEVRQSKKTELEQFLLNQPVHKNERFANDPFIGG